MINLIDISEKDMRKISVVYGHIPKGSDIRCHNDHLVYKLFRDAPYGPKESMLNPNRFVDTYNKIPTKGLKAWCTTCKATNHFYLRFKGSHVRDEPIDPMKI